MSLFSVIVPVYKVEKYLQQCVDSLLNQTYRDFELILVDDGSPDGSGRICDEYAVTDSRVRVVHKKNGGLVSARKAGAALAEGKYAVCVDGDDFVSENHLRYFADAIEKYSPDVVAGGFIKAYEDESKNVTNILPYRKGMYSREELKKEIFPLLIQNNKAEYFAPSVWAKAYRADLYKKMQQAVDDRIKIGEDGACTIPCIYHASSLYVTDKATYYYRQNPVSMTQEKKAFSWEGPKLIHEHLERLIDMNEGDFREQLYRKTVHELFTVVVSQFYRKESYKEIVADIDAHLKTDIYAEAIRHAKFKSAKGRLAAAALKYRLYPLIRMFSRIG